MKSRVSGGDVAPMRGLFRLLLDTALMAEDPAPAPPLFGGEQGDGTRERILDTAVAHFAAEGFAKPALDEIARAAGVTTADLVALFGSEEGLHRACDDYVLGALEGWAHEKATLEGMQEVMRSYQPVPRALAVLTATTVLGLITMAPHIERTLRLPASQQQMLTRLALPALEIYTHGLYTNDSYLTLVPDAVSAFQPEDHEQQTPGRGSRQEPPPPGDR